MISWYTVYYPQTGQIAAVFTADAASVDSNTPPGMARVDGRFDFRDGYIRDGEFVPFPSQPSNHHIFDWSRHEWVDPRNIDDFKAERWAAVKAARRAAELGGFTWDGSRFDSDAASQSSIQLAVQSAITSPAEGFSIDWTLSDNTRRALSAADMVAVGRALAAHVAAQHATARALREQIDSASSIEEVAAASWPAQEGGN